MATGVHEQGSVRACARGCVDDYVRARVRLRVGLNMQTRKTINHYYEDQRQPLTQLPDESSTSSGSF